MTLSFRQKFPNGKPTYFFEKIMAMNCFTIAQVDKLYFSLSDEKKIWFHENFDNDYALKCIPKIHTIREDKENRWNAGKLIHCVYNNRTKKRLQFAPVFKCKSVQTIRIVYPCPGSVPLIWIDNMPMGSQKVKKLAENDGFDSFPEFLNWFNTDFEGKIIHFTDFKY